MGFSADPASMRLLAVDTATEFCSVAVCDGADYLQQIEKSGGGHSQSILGMIEGILRQAELSLRHLDGIVVDTGPGSFTGLRVGLAVAQGISFGLGLPVLGINSLEILAFRVTGGTALPAIDARMKQVYYAIYRCESGHRPREIKAPEIEYPGRLAYHMAAPDFGCGSGWDVYRDEILRGADKNAIEVMPGEFPRALDALRIAQIIGFDGAVRPGMLEATYIRNKVAG